jgi:uncharacterized RDD family membrane protein YckC
MSVSATASHGSASPEKKTVTVIGFGKRLAATLLDGFLVFGMTLLVAFVVGFAAVFVNMYKPEDTDPMSGLLYLSILILSIGYYVRAWTRSGQTLGDQLFGIKVVGKDGLPVSSGRALLRFAGYIVSGLALSIGFLWIEFDKKRQGWHDKLAGTYVVDVDENFSDADAVAFEPSDPGKGWIWLVVWVLVAIIAPTALLASLFALGPVLNAIIRGIL